MTNAVAIVSGGLDSTTLVYEMLAQGLTPHLLSFDYGQRHKKELQFAALTARQLDLPHDIIDLSSITYLISNSALTSLGNELNGLENIEVPDGHYAEETMKATVVPNRNMIMLSIAAGVAVNEKAAVIGIGVHGGDHFIYPDCRPGFLTNIAAAIWTGNFGFSSLEPEVIYAPFLMKTKADIAYRALELDVPLHMTWSCYKGGDKHCGRCGTCVERLEAIDEAVIRYTNALAANTPEDIKYYDHTEYADTEFWKQAVREGARSV